MGIIVPPACTLISMLLPAETSATLGITINNKLLSIDQSDNECKATSLDGLDGCSFIVHSLEVLAEKISVHGQKQFL